MIEKNAVLIFPHQLFKNNPLISKGATFYLIETFLYFKQYNFHKQKIAFHRASMKFYAEHLRSNGVTVIYIDANNKFADARKMFALFIKEDITSLSYIDTTDYWLEKRLISSSAKFGIKLKKIDSPLFLNTPENLADFFRKDKKKYFQTKFYIEQRKERKILLDKEGKALGGKWSFDAENRKKYPKNKSAPAFFFPESNPYFDEAYQYVNKHFKDNLGLLESSPIYPIDFNGAEKALDQFLHFRFYDFGSYEDAIVKEEHFLNHSVLTPMLNVGLISPQLIIEKSLAFADKNKIPINSTEGFIRQIIGWREFIRGVYEVKGVEERTKNFWGFKKKIPSSFYDGSTGIPPIDDTIQKVLKTGYCHHIERLMILGNFMLLCEFDPDEVHRWFMELFIDAYDWVMVPNVYGMSQFADGGTFATKPYVGGSNYIRKMSNYPKGEWANIWDGLFWRFIDKHQEFFKSNPRTSMLFYSYRKMSKEKKDTHLSNAESFLARTFAT